MKNKEKAREVRSWILTVVVPVTAVLLINLFLCKLAIVNGDSMYPTLHNRDLLLVWMVDYTPKSSDIIVINTEKDSVMQGEKLVKRVIATGGQTVQIDYAANTVAVDGQVLDEPYLNQADGDPMMAVYQDETIKVPEGYVFVMGDNRNHSADSRDTRIGLIPVGEILGVKVARIPVGQWLGE